MTLAGKKILLTGVSRGIGRATARLLLDEGVQLLGVGRDAGRLQEAEAELSSRGSGTFHSLCLDIAQPGSAERLHDHVSQLWKQLDIAVFNAAVMLHHEGGILAEPTGILEQSLETNLLAPLRMARSLLPLLEAGKEPRIVNVGSGAGTLAQMHEPGIASYRLSKWALNGLTLLESHELADKISVIAFDPGWVRTDLGGPKAPGTPEEAAEGLLATLQLEASCSGKFYKNAQEIPW